MLTTPLLGVHRREGAKLVDFAGWLLPLHYGSILDEARTVRTRCGLFDVSHMGRLVVKGAEAASALDYLVTQAVASLAIGQVRYGFLCNERAGILDDLTVARLSDDEFLLVVNAARRQADFQWLQQHLPSTLLLEDRTLTTAMLAIQGPDALTVVDKLTDGTEKPSALKRFRSGVFSLCGVFCLVSRTGYTGEDGVEIICPSEAAETLWSALRNEGVPPCGLGARDILRLEAGFCLYGHDLDETTNPAEADLMRFVGLDKSFMGRDALLAQLNEGVRRKRVGLKLASRATPRQGAPVLSSGQIIGRVTSGAFSPHLNTAIAMAYVASEWGHIGARVQVLVRDQLHDAEIVAMPFLPLPSRKAE